MRRIGTGGEGRAKAQGARLQGVGGRAARSVLCGATHLGTLAQTAIKWITRVPATVREAQIALGQADPQAMVTLPEG